MIIHQQNAQMLGIQSKDYRPSLVFRNAHFATMYPYGFRQKPMPKYERERIETQDGDFIDVDFVKKSSRKVVLLLHGLEGSSSSQYILGLIQKLTHVDTDICAINHRSCSGELNRNITMYHSGFTDDIELLIQTLGERYDQIFAVGYSMGGNMIMKYLGQGQVHPNIVKAAAISVPLDLNSSSIALDQWVNRPYVWQFLHTLNKKIVAKVQQHPDTLGTLEYKGIKTLMEYDDKVTAPLHGFASGRDYYEKASSKPYLSSIQTPTLLINADDDPFLTQECMPVDIADGHEYFHFWQQRFGGHVGFGGWRSGEYWVDEVVVEWLFQSNFEVKPTSFTKS